MSEDGNSDPNLTNLWHGSKFRALFVDRTRCRSEPPTSTGLSPVEIVLGVG